VLSSGLEGTESQKKKSLRVFIAGNIPAASGPAAKICPPAPPLKVGVAYPITVGDGRSQEVLPWCSTALFRAATFLNDWQQY
jgi:hypothetical protein